jgi:molybdate transport system ATP-binding protein
MDLEVDIERELRSPERRFHLRVRFTLAEDLAVLYGPSGAGKSMTLQAIAGLLRPDAGRIRYGGDVLFDSKAGIDVPARRRGMGYVFQDYALFPHRTVYQNVAAAAAPMLGHRLRDRDRERVASLLAAFELAPIAASYPGQISGGQRQRTALARALAAEPRLLLLDEPFNALDTELRARMRREVLQVGERFKVPILLITHDAADSAAFGRQVIRIEDGRIVDETPPARVAAMQRPADAAPLSVPLSQRRR